jgi:hypothetical protein
MGLRAGTPASLNLARPIAKQNFTMNELIYEIHSGEILLVAARTLSEKIAPRIRVFQAPVGA